ncbi:MAG: endonuclease domain-containing protein [Acetobacteraceae bacterium]
MGEAAMNLRPQAVRARRLRRNSTEVEQRLWRALRQAGLPWRFRRQHPIVGRIVDLACPARKLAIELDRGKHDQHRAADALRSATIESHGYRVTRFWNNDVMENLEGVLQSIRAALENPPAAV